MSTTSKFEVFRKTPEVGKWYETSRWTEKTGTQVEENERYFTNAKPRYIGQLIHRNYIEFRTYWYWELRFKDNDGNYMTLSYQSDNNVAFREVADTKPSRVEVFRKTPEVGKYYEYAECTEKIGSYLENNDKYFTTNPLRYVGKYIKHERYGWGDSADHFSIFDNKGEEIRIEYSYEGNTCFREVIYTEV